MSWKKTWWWVLMAVALYVFIVAFERRQPYTFDPLAPRLVSFKASEVSLIQVRRTNQIILRAERTNGTWNLTLPLSYPAQDIAIEGLLKELENLTSHTHITKEELSDQRQTEADFGLDVPTASVSLQSEDQRMELYFGRRTSAGDEVYLQVLNQPGIFLASAELLNRLPATATDWRDTALLHFGTLAPDRMEVRAAGRGFAIQVDPTNQSVQLIKPTPARADRAKVEAILRTLQSARVVQFVTDDVRAAPESYGLQPPEAELVFGVGTNDGLMVQFGKSPTNDPAMVYARRLSQTNVVLVARTVLEALLTPYSELRERRLLTFQPETVTAIEAAGDASFGVRSYTNGLWRIGEPPGTPADAGLISDWLSFLARLEATVEKEFVTDFASYGLAKPTRQYFLRAASTNAAGMVTNPVVAQLDIGTRVEKKVFVRRPDEQSVYSIRLGEFELLPAAPWQLRDRRLWSFTTNQVQRVVIRQRGYSRTIERNAQGRWALAAGSQGIIPGSEAIEEVMFRLGQLRAEWWVAQGAIDRNKYGLTEDGYRLTIDLKRADKAEPLILDFGGWNQDTKFPYAMTLVDGQPVVFEFPPQLFWLLQRDLANPPPRSAARD